MTDFPGKTRHFNIASEIGTKYRIVGTALLNDESGVIIPAIVSKHKGNVEFINLEVLNQWVQGQGVKCSWLNLIHALRLPCSKLAEDIEESLSAEERSGVRMICIIIILTDIHNNYRSITIVQSDTGKYRELVAQYYY